MTTEYELMHHGILGMKWGVRRYQAYGEGGYNPKHKGKNQLTKEQSHRARKAARAKRIREQRDRDAKDVSMISDAALDQKVRRLQKEKQLKDITEEMVHPGRSFVKKLTKGTAMTAATGATAYAGYLLVQKAMGTRVHLPKPTKLALTPTGLKKADPLRKRLKGLKVTVGKAEALGGPKAIANVVMKGGFKKK